MYPLIARHNNRHLMGQVALLSILLLGALEVHFVVHDIYEPDCIGRQSDNDALCPICSAHSLLNAETALPVVIVLIEQSHTYIPATLDLIAPSWEPIQNPGRAPPSHAC